MIPWSAFAIAELAAAVVKARRRRAGATVPLWGDTASGACLVASDRPLRSLRAPQGGTVNVECFWVEPTGMVRRWLRRYGGHCPTRDWTDSTGEIVEGSHSAMVFVDDVPAVRDLADGRPVLRNSTVGRPDFADDDARWPTTCAVCGDPLPGDAKRQLFTMELYARPDNPAVAWVNRALATPGEGCEPLPAGAMFDAWWMPFDRWRGDDGRSITVMLPDGTLWHVDGQASNCTRPGEPHHCWVRHGEPPRLTVDKRGDTCSAGAGSIGTDSYHGFLRDGCLVPA